MDYLNLYYKMSNAEVPPKNQPTNFTPFLERNGGGLPTLSNPVSDEADECNRCRSPRPPSPTNSSSTNQPPPRPHPRPSPVSDGAVVVLVFVGGLGDVDRSLQVVRFQKGNSEGVATCEYRRLVIHILECSVVVVIGVVVGVVYGDRNKMRKK